MVLVTHRYSTHGATVDLLLSVLWCLRDKQYQMILAAAVSNRGQKILLWNFKNVETLNLKLFTIEHYFKVLLFVLT